MAYYRAKANTTNRLQLQDQEVIPYQACQLKKKDFHHRVTVSTIISSHTKVRGE